MAPFLPQISKNNMNDNVREKCMQLEKQLQEMSYMLGEESTWLLWMQNKVWKVLSAGLAIRHQESTARWINSVV